MKLYNTCHHTTFLFFMVLLLWKLHKLSPMNYSINSITTCSWVVFETWHLSAIECLDFLTFSRKIANCQAFSRLSRKVHYTSHKLEIWELLHIWWTNSNLQTLIKDYVSLSKKGCAYCVCGLESNHPVQLAFEKWS